jgi:hypothetical protein
MRPHGAPIDASKSPRRCVQRFGVRVLLGGDEGEVVAGSGLVAQEDDGDGHGAGTGVPQAGERAR